MISRLNIHNIHLKCFGNIRYPLDKPKTLTKNINQTAAYMYT